MALWVPLRRPCPAVQLLWGIRRECRRREGRGRWIGWIEKLILNSIYFLFEFGVNHGKHWKVLRNFVSIFGWKKLSLSENGNSFSLSFSGSICLPPKMQKESSWNKKNTKLFLNFKYKILIYKLFRKNKKNYFVQTFGNAV